MERIKLFFNKIFKEYKCYVTFFLIVINVLIYVGMFLDSGNLEYNSIYMYEKGALYTGADANLEWYRMISAMFLHFDLKHLLNNMLMLAVIGSMIERFMGSVSFGAVYFLGGILGNLLSFHMHQLKNQIVVAAGASGGVFAVSGALVLVFLMLRSRMGNQDSLGQRILLFVALLLFQCFGKTGVDNYAHLGGLVAGFLLAALFMNIRLRVQKKNSI